MAEQIILYDLPSRDPLRSFSGNAWKTRLVLNFKNISYKTEWIKYIHLQQTLKAFGLKPNPPGSWSEYSVPTVRWPDGTYQMDSAAIAVELEKLYPDPSLNLNAEIEAEAEAAMSAVFMSLIFLLGPMAIKHLVHPDDVEWFKADRAGRFNVPVEALEKSADADALYAAAQPAFEKVRAVLTSHKKDNGPFILGSVPSYADFYIVSTVLMYKQASPEALERLLKEGGAELRQLYEACGKWYIRDT